MKSSKKTVKKWIKRPFFAAILAVIFVAGTYFAFFHKTAGQVTSTKKIVSSGTAPKASQAAALASTTPVEKTPLGSSASADGSAVDTHGQNVSSANSSQWTTSASGQITVRQPAGNAKLASGSPLSGTAKVSGINYRLIDNSVGVIAQGSLSVNDNNFSGTLQFQPKSSGGRLDVFSTQPDGTEINEVQIYVTF